MVERRKLAERLGNGIDSLVGIFSPGRQNRRIGARRRREVAEAYHLRRMRQLSDGGFESARNTRDAHSWLTKRLSPDSALEEAREEMLERADSVYKNYTFGRGYVESRVGMIAGCGTKIKPRIMPRDGVITEDQATAWNQILEEAYDQWKLRAGFKLQPLYMLERLAMRCWDRFGDVFVMFGDVFDPRAPVTLKVQVVHPNRVQTPPGESGNRRIRMGVETDENDLPIAYWVRRTHEFDTLDVSQEFDRIDARFANGMPRMLHIYEETEPGQTRGYPDLQIAYDRLKNTQEYEEAELERNNVGACYAAFVHTELPAEDAAEGQATGGTGPRGQRQEDIAPGKITYLGLADKVTVGQPSGPQAAYKPYMEDQRRSAASGVNYPYEMITGDWGSANYSRSKVIWTIGGIPISCRQFDLRTLFLMPTWSHFVNRMVIGSGPLEIPLLDVDQSLYRAMPWVFEEAIYIPPARPRLDPAREQRADMADVAAGFTSPQRIIPGLTGEDNETIYDELAADRVLREARGISTQMPMMGLTESDADDDDDDDRESTEIGDTQPESEEVTA
ncbi:MAG: phage portal protein [Planctomycetota bacterium]|nr:phage portal protein [Planctomycetota bacterium]